MENLFALAASTLFIIVSNKWHAFVITRFDDATTVRLLDIRRQLKHFAYFNACCLTTPLLIFAAIDYRIGW
jgi:hypothetical protein